jgi:hypothetical protein
MNHSGSISGQLKDKFGNYIVGAMIKVLPKNKVEKEENVSEIVSDFIGGFKLEGLIPGDYVIFIKANGFATFSLSSVKIVEKLETKITATLSFKSTCDGQEKVLSEAEKISLINTTLEHVFLIKDWPGPICKRALKNVEK